MHENYELSQARRFLPSPMRMLQGSPCDPKVWDLQKYVSGLPSSVLTRLGRKYKYIL